MKTSKYIVNGILVEAVRSEGGLFYEGKILATGSKFRILARVFEQFAKEVVEAVPGE